MIEVISENEMQAYGEKVGRLLHGGELIELSGDVGSGKTTFVRGIALGMGVDEVIQSPSFTINRVYDTAGGKRLVHYDFYRLNNPGIMAAELSEALSDTETTVVIEWAESVSGVLPSDRLKITFVAPSSERRLVTVRSGGERSMLLAEKLA